MTQLLRLRHWAYLVDYISMEKLVIKEYYYGRENRHSIEDDLVDRLNNKVTILILMSSIFILSASMYVGKPINCWAPGNIVFETRIRSVDLFLRRWYLGEFKVPHDTYMNSVCWLKGSYYLPTAESMLHRLVFLTATISRAEGLRRAFSAWIPTVDLKIHHRMRFLVLLVTIPDRSQPRTYFM